MAAAPPPRCAAPRFSRATSSPPGANGRAVLVRGQEYVIVAARTRLRLPAAAEARGFVQILQDWGRATFRIEKKATPHFGVKTPHLVALVKGTTFTVTADGKGAAVAVEEGRVEVGTPDGAVRQLVDAGMAASIASAQPRPDRDAARAAAAGAGSAEAARACAEDGGRGCGPKLAYEPVELAETLSGPGAGSRRARERPRTAPASAPLTAALLEPRAPRLRRPVPSRRPSPGSRPAPAPAAGTRGSGTGAGPGRARDPAPAPAPPAPAAPAPPAPAAPRRARTGSGSRAGHRLRLRLRLRRLPRRRRQPRPLRQRLQCRRPGGPATPAVPARSRPPAHPRRRSRPAPIPVPAPRRPTSPMPARRRHAGSGARSAAPAPAPAPAARTRSGTGSCAGSGSGARPGSGARSGSCALLLRRLRLRLLRPLRHQPLRPAPTPPAPCPGSAAAASGSGSGSHAGVLPPARRRRQPDAGSSASSDAPAAAGAGVQADQSAHHLHLRLEGAGSSLTVRQPHSAKAVSFLAGMTEAGREDGGGGGTCWRRFAPPGSASPEPPPPRLEVAAAALDGPVAPRRRPIPRPWPCPVEPGEQYPPTPREEAVGAGRRRARRAARAGGRPPRRLAPLGRHERDRRQQRHQRHRASTPSRSTSATGRCRSRSIPICARKPGSASACRPRPMCGCRSPPRRRWRSTSKAMRSNMKARAPTMPPLLVAAGLEFGAGAAPDGIAPADRLRPLVWRSEGARGRRAARQLAPSARARSNLRLAVDARIFDSGYGDAFGGSQASLYLTYDSVLNPNLSVSGGVYARREWLGDDAFSSLDAGVYGGLSAFLERGFLRRNHRGPQPNALRRALPAPRPGPRGRTGGSMRAPG